MAAKTCGLVRFLVFALVLCACAADHGSSAGTGGKGGAGASGAKATSGGAGGAGGARATGASGSTGPTGKLPANGPPCVVSSTVATIAVTNIDKVDMLFVVDNSDSMADKQLRLRAQFPHMITVLTTGDMDGDGKNDFPPAQDLHLGVVTSDMGLPGVQGIRNCQGLGLDGILQNKPSSQVTGCQAAYPPFLGFSAGVGPPTQTATDLACVSAVGTSGCGFEHPLEASLKALWPQHDPMAVNGMNRIQFLTDPTSGLGANGHGDVENLGFLRNDPIQGLSLIAVIVLTDEDDCSSSDTRAFTPPQYLDPNDPLVMQGMNLRCHFNQSALYPIERYINGLKALRPGNENLVVFAAITGVPGDLVSSAELAKTDFSMAAQRDGFYQNILGDQRMQEVVDNLGTADPSDDKLKHSCVDVTAGGAGPGQIGAADPPIRIVKVAQGFGQNGIVQSICEADYGPALDAITGVIAKQLGAVCLPRSLVRNASGLVDCDVVWELPPPGMVPVSTPTSCGGDSPWLLSPAADETQVSDRGGAICKVAQLAVVQDASGAFNGIPTATNGHTFTTGWYYDDFSDEVKKSCTGMGGKQRISFTAEAKPPTGVTVKLKCLNQSPSMSMAGIEPTPSCSAGPKSTSHESVGQACLPHAIPESGFDDREAYLETSDTDCGGGVCLVYHLRGDPRPNCVSHGTTPSDAQVCAAPAEVQSRVYCSCRCNAPDGYAECGCPDGFACVDVLDQGDPEIRGGYCVKNGTFTQ